VFADGEKELFCPLKRMPNPFRKAGREGGSSCLHKRKNPSLTKGGSLIKRESEHFASPLF